MLIYVIEDDPIKSGRICQFLGAEFGGSEITVLRSFQSGLKAIEEKQPNFLILDMNLPTFDRSPGKREGRIRPLGGYELMRKVKLRNIDLKFVIVSQLEYFGEGADKITFDQVTEFCRAEFPSMFYGSVYFSQSSLSWQVELITYVNKIIGSSANNCP